MPTPDKLFPPIATAAVVTVPVKVGEALNTKLPVPVEVVVTAESKLALVGAAKKAATPVPRPLIPVDTGKPVPLVNTTAEGVPRAGVTNVGDV